MQTLFVGQNIIRLESTPSTNLYAQKLLQLDGVLEGTVVFATSQSEGRGQRGNNWESEVGKNLILSIILHPRFISLKEQFLLNQTISLGVLDFINHFVPLVKIKWPNDILLNGKKLAGILIENQVKGPLIQSSVIGIGININQDYFSDEIKRATSLKRETGKEYNLDELLIILLGCIEARYLQLRADANKIRADYMKVLFQLDEWKLYKVAGAEIALCINALDVSGKIEMKNRNGDLILFDLKEIEFIY